MQVEITFIPLAHPHKIITQPYTRSGTYPQTNFNSRPQHNRLAIRIRLQILDGEDADDLDDGDEEAQGEDSHKGDLLSAA